jgi:hypothetical protein
MERVDTRTLNHSDQYIAGMMPRNMGFVEPAGINRYIAAINPNHFTFQTQPELPNNSSFLDEINQVYSYVVDLINGQAEHVPNPETKTHFVQLSRTLSAWFQNYAQYYVPIPDNMFKIPEKKTPPKPRSGSGVKASQATMLAIPPDVRTVDSIYTYVLNLLHGDQTNVPDQEVYIQLRLLGNALDTWFRQPDNSPLLDVINQIYLYVVDLINRQAVLLPIPETRNQFVQLSRTLSAWFQNYARYYVPIPDNMFKIPEKKTPPRLTQGSGSRTNQDIIPAMPPDLKIVNSVYTYVLNLLRGDQTNVPDQAVYTQLRLLGNALETWFLQPP